MDEYTEMFIYAQERYKALLNRSLFLMKKIKPIN